MNDSSGKKFWDALAEEKPLQIVGAINAYSAILAEKSGYKALYLSGGGVAAASYGVPDLGITQLKDVVIDVERISNASALPLLVDIDTGFDDVSATIKAMIKAGAAAVHIEDQVAAKRCGHLQGKSLVSSEEMVERITAVVDARTHDDFVIMARTDALAVEGFDKAVERMQAYIAAGADMIFPEAFTELAQYEKLSQAIEVPFLANITEFGKTPLFTRDELAKVGVSMILYPLSAFRAMSAAALKVYKTIKAEGTQQSVIDSMQTRKELYEYLNYVGWDKPRRSFSKDGRSHQQKNKRRKQ